MVRGWLLGIDWVSWLALLISTITLILYIRREVFLLPRVKYSLEELTEYPGTGQGLSLAIHRVELSGPIGLKWGMRVHLRSSGGKPASDIQVRATAPSGAFIIQVHTDDEKLVQRLPDIGRQGTTEVFVNIPLMVPKEEVTLTFWYGLPNSRAQPQALKVLVRHAEGLGTLTR